MMPRILIVGAGVTGSACAQRLRQKLQQNLDLVIWDKSRGTGGRMSTSRNPDNNQSIADLGAQYITATPTYADKHASYYTDLTSCGLLQPLTSKIDGMKEDEQGTKHFVAPQGTSSLVKHFIKQSETDVQCNHFLAKVDIVKKDMESDFKVAATSQEEGKPEGHPEPFDAVILTMPLPQIMRIPGTIQDYLAKNLKVKESLESARYSSRYALGLFFSPNDTIDVPWDAKYVTDDPCIRFLSIDNRKRGIKESSNLGISMVVHTSVPFGIKYLESDKNEIEAMVVHHVRQRIPNLPQPTSIKCTRWRYSQVSTPVAGTPGCIFLNKLPSCAIIATGDAFVHSNFDGCITAAETTCDQLLSHFKESGLLGVDSGL